MRINELILSSLKAEASEAELRELQAWRDASSENDQYYLDYEALWKLTADGDSLAVGAPPTFTDITAGASAEVPKSGPGLARPAPYKRPVRRPARRRPWFPRWRAPAAAAAIVVVGIGSWALATTLERSAAEPLVQGADEFVTGMAETATVGLRDGSVIRLAPSSRLTLSGTMDRRDVTLKGRAYLAVAHDEARPFRVRTDAGTVTVLGTRFDLQTDGEDLRLVVLEGRVAVSTGARKVEVAAGEMARVLAGTLVPPVRVPEVLTVVDWVGTFLAFQATPMGQAAREIEAVYGVRIEFADAGLADRTVTGWFADRSLDEVLRVVCAVVSVRCTRAGDTVTIEPAPDLEPIDASSAGSPLNFLVRPTHTSGGKDP